MYPETTDSTPLRSSYTASRHQKQPPASVATSRPGPGESCVAMTRFYRSPGRREISASAWYFVAVPATEAVMRSFLAFLYAIAAAASLPALAQSGQGLEKATFAGGCFWCMEPPFDQLPGV